MEIRSFHGLATYCRHFIRNFSSIVPPITNCLKKRRFKWEEEEDASCKEIKEKLTTTLVLMLPNSDKLFEVETDACMTRIETVLMEEKETSRFFLVKN